MVTQPKTSEVDAEMVARLEPIARRIMIEVGHGNRELAHRLVDDAFTHCTSDGILETPLAAIGLEYRLVSILEGQECLTIGDLLEMPDLLEVPYIAERTAITIYAAVAKAAIKRAISLET